MAQDTRPLSPHLQIYRPQLTWVLSIFHRGTGVVLSVGAIVLAGWLMAAAAGPDSFRVYQAFLTSLPGLLVLAALSFCLFYHLCNGIRHLVWDTGRWLDLRAVYVSGWGVVAVSFGLTAGLWAYLLLRAKGAG